MSSVRAVREAAGSGSGRGPLAERAPFIQAVRRERNMNIRKMLEEHPKFECCDLIRDNTQQEGKYEISFIRYILNCINVITCVFFLSEMEMKSFKSFKNTRFVQRMSKSHEHDTQNTQNLIFSY